MREEEHFGVSEEKLKDLVMPVDSLRYPLADVEQAAVDSKMLAPTDL